MAYLEETEGDALSQLTKPNLPKRAKSRVMRSYANMLIHLMK
jgi:hypothetical protein